MTVAVSHETSARLASPWVLLRHPLFRTLFLATSVSNIGVWMQEVGRAWLMTELTPSPLYVAMIQASAMAGMVLFALPAGVVADMFDLRRVLVVSQVWLMLAAFALAALTMASAMTPVILILLTFAAAAGAAFVAPAWQAALPELVGTDSMPAAVTLNGLSFNVARAIGPAVGGIIVTLAGPAAVFMLNGLSFAGVIVALLFWHPRKRPPPVAPQTAVSALKDGLRFARSSEAFRGVVARTALFAFPASALWALLPLLARQTGGAGAYGLLLTLLGAGAVVTALVLPTARRLVDSNRLSFAASLILAAALGFTLIGGFPAQVAAMLGAGLGWLTTLTLLTVAAQASVPGWVRGRALSMFLLVFSGAMALGSVAWGLFAERFGVPAGMGAAALTQAIAAGASLIWRLPADDDARAIMAQHEWPAPSLASKPDLGQGPVMVSVTYDVSAERRASFLAAMHALGPLRRTEGSTAWTLYESGRSPGRFIELNVVATWGDHLRQRDRGSAAALAHESDIAASLVPGSSPEVDHWFGSTPARTRTDTSWVQHILEKT